MTEKFYFIYCEEDTGEAVLGSEEAVHSGLMHKYQVDITGSQRDR